MLSTIWYEGAINQCYIVSHWMFIRVFFLVTITFSCPIQKYPFDFVTRVILCLQYLLTSLCPLQVPACFTWAVETSFPTFPNETIQQDWGRQGNTYQQKFSAMLNVSLCCQFPILFSPIHKRTHKMCLWYTYTCICINIHTFCVCMNTNTLKATLKLAGLGQ